jgi:hypothetical protein
MPLTLSDRRDGDGRRLAVADVAVTLAKSLIVMLPLDPTEPAARALVGS